MIVRGAQGLRAFAGFSDTAPKACARGLRWDEDIGRCVLDIKVNAPGFEIVKVSEIETVKPPARTVPAWVWIVGGVLGFVAVVAIGRSK